MRNMFDLHFTQQTLDASRDLQVSRHSSMEEIQIISNKQKIPAKFLPFFLTWPHMLTHINWGASLE